MKADATTDNVDPLFAKARFDNSYARLPERFYARLEPAPVKAPRLIRFNRALAEELGLDSAFSNKDLIAEIFSGNYMPAQMEPVAMAYAGHQFGGLVPQLGDGRAILLGEVIDIHGRRRDIQLKGSGRTPFSRQGDGRSPLGPVVREYIVSEAMHALGIPTTRSLAAVATGETVLRETPLPGAVLTRVAASHIRIGTFEYFSVRGDGEATRLLADHVIGRHYPAVQESGNPYLSLLDAVVEKQVRLIAAWMHVGFIHGVMNTDNMAISGKTIDYGPCAFMDSYDPAAVFSSIDFHGRYAYGNQPYIAQWNLARFAETLLPLIDENVEKAIEKAEASINTFPALFEAVWLEGMCRKLGLQDRREGDKELITSLLNLMQAQDADFTLTFRALCEAAEDNVSALRASLGDSKHFENWFSGWQARLRQQTSTSLAGQAAAMRAVNPLYIPRNHLVEQAISSAVEQNDFTVMETLLKVLSKPYDERKEYEAYTLPPKPDERVCQTFCGT